MHDGIMNACDALLRITFLGPCTYIQHASGHTAHVCCAHADSMRRETSAVRSAADGNKLRGALPAALGALTDLVALCARSPPIPRGGEGPARPRSGRVGALTRACGAAQLPSLERLDRHDRRLDRLAGEAHTLVRPRPRVHGGYPGCGACALTRRVLLGVLEYSAPWGLRCDLRDAACARTVCVRVCVCVCLCVC